MSKKNRRRKARQAAADSAKENPARSEVLEWRIFPLRDNPQKSVIALAATVLSGLIITLSFYGDVCSGGMSSAVYFALILCVVAFFVVVFSHLFFPTKYTMSDEGVKIANGLNRRGYVWDKFSAFKYDATCLMLSPFVAPNRIRSLRAVQIFFGGDNREEVIAFVSKKVEVDETKGAKDKPETTD